MTCFGSLTAPAWLQSDSTQIAIAAGNDFACSLSLAGAVKCWGGVGSWSTVLSRTVSPTDVPGDLPRDIVAITAGRNHACALSLNRRAFCWGNPDGGKTSVPSALQGNIKLPCVPRAFWSQISAIYSAPSPASAVCSNNALRPFPSFDLIGSLLMTLTLSSEAACRSACCALPSCEGYSFSARLLPALPSAPCFLLANVTQLVPSNMMNAGLRNSAPS